MPAITKKMIVATYKEAKEYYHRKKSRSMVLRELQKVGMNPATASHFIQNFRKMMLGETYKRQINLEATEYFFEKIWLEYGPNYLKKALKATEGSVAYYLKKKNENLIGLKALIQKFRIELEINSALTIKERLKSDNLTPKLPYYPINSTYRRAISYSSRVRFLILHYTAGNFEHSIQALTEILSSHYLVPDPTDSTYPLKNLEIINLVDEKDRAWHAGVSAWEDRNNINDQSIGIEIVNTARVGSKGYNFPPYNRQQIEAVIQLTQNIIQRYPYITPTRIIGHSDIAIERKVDPGPAFPWYRLYQNGVGAWYDEATKEKYIKQDKRRKIKISLVQALLKKYGYAIKQTGEDDSQTKATVKAFQMHFRPKDYSGNIDLESQSILKALIEKYFPDSDIPL